MQKPLPEISKQIYPETILGIFEKKYSYIGPAWASLQLEWMNEVYKTFNDYEKFMILVYLRNKTFDFFSKNFVKMSFDEYFICLLYTSPSPRDGLLSRMPSSA